MRKVLVIAYVFPPIAYAGTHRTMRLCRHLSDMGYDLDILTIDIQKDLHNDYQLMEKIESKVRIIRTPIIDPYRYYRKLRARLGENFLSKIIGSIAGRTAELISIPDHMVYWILNAFMPALWHVGKNNYSIIYTTSPPHSEQMIGYLLKKIKPSIKWVADLRDPILDNLIIDKISVHNRFAHRWIEQKIAANADATIFNTKFAKDRFCNRYSKSKAYLIRNSYDESNFQSSSLTLYEKFTISHVGSIYTFRNVDLLFEAVTYLYKNKKIDSKKFRLLFVGLSDTSLKEKILGFGIESFVEIRDMLPHQQAIEVMRRSHVLMLIKGFGKNSESQIPGKLYEYLASGNPIAHIGPSKSEAAEIINSENAGRTFTNNAEDLAHFLHDIYLKFLHKPRSTIASANCRSYSSEKMAKQMHQVFDSLWV